MYPWGLHNKIPSPVGCFLGWVAVLLSGRERAQELQGHLQPLCRLLHRECGPFQLQKQKQRSRSQQSLIGARRLLREVEQQVEQQEEMVVDEDEDDDKDEEGKGEGVVF